MMACGCAGATTHRNEHDGLTEGHPSCLTHNCCEVTNAPDLKNRTAQCAYSGVTKSRRRYANDECNYGCQGKDTCECGDEPSKVSLAFFEHKPDQAQDTFYCGCLGWD